MAKDKHESLSQLNGAEIIIPTITTDESIEPVVNAEFKDALSEVAAREAFMNEIVTVIVHASTDENQPTHIVLDCNQFKQTFFRDVPTPCRRMFVEILARCKETKYTQQRNQIELDRSEMQARTALAYPFSVTEDKNPKGRAWLSAILAERS